MHLIRSAYERAAWAHELSVNQQCSRLWSLLAGKEGPSLLLGSDVIQVREGNWGQIGCRLQYGRRKSEQVILLEFQPLQRLSWHWAGCRPLTGKLQLQVRPDARECVLSLQLYGPRRSSIRAGKNLVMRLRQACA